MAGLICDNTQPSKRNIQVHFKMTAAEIERMRLKMKEVGVHNQSAYLRKMALDGYCINLNLEDISEVRSLLRYCSNNLNQYAKKANETGNIYAEDIADLQKRQDEIWLLLKKVLGTLASIN